jgi:hypothetical protein
MKTMSTIAGFLYFYSDIRETSAVLRVSYSNIRLETISTTSKSIPTEGGQAQYRRNPWLEFSWSCPCPVSFISDIRTEWPLMSACINYRNLCAFRKLEKGASSYLWCLSGRPSRSRRLSSGRKWGTCTPRCGSRTYNILKRMASKVVVLYSYYSCKCLLLCCISLDIATPSHVSSIH